MDAESLGLFIGHTNVSRPEIHDAGSAQSIAASEDYYSLASTDDHSERSSPVSAIRRYTTPPSRYRTPMPSRERLQPRMEYAVDSGAMRGSDRRLYFAEEVPSPLASNPRVSPATASTLSSQENSPDTLRRAPVLAMSSAAAEAHRDPTPDPGLDDTPYIHFALDQLTRDEEVRGSSRIYPTPDIQPVVSGNPDRASYVPLTALNEERTEPRPARPIIIPVESKPANPVITPLESRPAVPIVNPLDSRPANPIITSVEPIKRKPVGTGSNRNSATSNRNSSGSNRYSLTPSQREYPASVLMAAAGASRAQQDVPPRNPSRLSSPTVQSIQKRMSSTEIFLAFHGSSSPSWIALNALPRLLRPVYMIAFILVLALLTIALLFAAIWSLKRGRLWDYNGFGDNRYFVFEYLPTLLGCLLLLWILEIRAAVFRIAPFVALASDSPISRSWATLLPFFPRAAIVPVFDHFTAGQPAFGFFLLTSWLYLFTIPLLASSFNVYQIGTTWVWLATQGVIWIVIALLVLHLASAVWLLAYLRNRSTGLKWDATSLADIIVLLESSNVLNAYAAFFDAVSVDDFREDILARGDRIGYWATSTRPSAHIHTLGAPGQAARQYSVENGVLTERANPVFGAQGVYRSLHPHQDETDLSPTYHYRPTILRPEITIPLALTLTTLLIAFLIASYLPSTRLASGFTPRVPVPVNAAGFSATNFVYSFIPSLLGLTLFLLWNHIDTTLRRLHPIAALSRGAPASSSLLASDPFSGPLAIHSPRLALASITALAALALPVLAGGIFFAEFYTASQTVRVTPDPAAFRALTALFALAALASWSLLATGAYAVPSPPGARRTNRFERLVDVLALLHQSRLLVDAEFRAPGTRERLLARLVAGVVPDDASGSRGEGARFGIGRYRGRDGRVYVGVERAERLLAGGKRAGEAV